MPIDNPLPYSYRKQVEQILPFYPISVDRFAPHTRKFKSAEDLLGMIALKSRCGQGVHAYNQSSGKLLHLALILTGHQGQRYDTTDMHIRAVHVHAQL